MGESYLVLWSQDRCRTLKKAGDVGKSLQVLFGGPHISAPSFRRYGVAAGDWVNVGAFQKGTLFIVARLRVKEIIGVGDYLWTHLGFQGSSDSSEAPRNLGHRWPEGCVEEAVVGEESTSIRFDLAVPLELLTSLRFRNKRGQERGLRVEDGKLKGISGMQGHVMRFATDSGRAIEALVLSSPTPE